MNNNFFISSRLSAVYRGSSVLTSETSCSSYSMKTSPAKTHFQMCPFSADTRSEKSRTPPDRSAKPYYVESFQFQPGSMEREFKILKVLSETLPWSQSSGLTADNMNSALLFSWESTFSDPSPEVRRDDLSPIFFALMTLGPTPSANILRPLGHLMGGGERGRW